LKLKRKLEIVVISDVHLGTSRCHAKQLLDYLNRVEPKKLILNGDIINIREFRKRNFETSHLRVIKKIITFASEGVEVIYITGNHDESLRRFSNTTLGHISIVNKLVLEIDGKKALFFHGDIFDTSAFNAVSLYKLGDYGYYLLLRLNRLINWYLKKIGQEKFSLSKKIKKNTKKALKLASNFEKSVTDLAIDNNYHYVICGHIHKPKMIEKSNKKGKTIYLNSGDWVENFSALEYQFKRWKIYNSTNEKKVVFPDKKQLIN